jgi:hypothetical protein
VAKGFLNSFVFFHFEISPPKPVGLRNWNASPFATFEKISAAADYSNTCCVVTEPKEEAYPVTVLFSIDDSRTMTKSLHFF